MSEEFVPTPIGPARITWYQPDGPARAVAMLGHGSATGIESADLQALAAALPGRGVAVALITQPYRLARSRSSRASDEGSLDIAWRGVWPHVASLGLPVIAGGRSAGSQVAAPRRSSARSACSPWPSRCSDRAAPGSCSPPAYRC